MSFLQFFLKNSSWNFWRNCWNVWDRTWGSYIFQHGDREAPQSTHWNRLIALHFLGLSHCTRYRIPFRRDELFSKIHHKFFTRIPLIPWDILNVTLDDFLVEFLAMVLQVLQRILFDIRAKFYSSWKSRKNSWN